MRKPDEITAVEGDFAALLEVDHVKVHVFRELRIQREGDSWLVMVSLPDRRTPSGQYHLDDDPGGLSTCDPVVGAFLEHILRLIADPKAFAPDVTFTPYKESAPKLVNPEAA